MSDVAVRVVVAVVLLAVAAGVGLAARRIAKPSHPRIDLGSHTEPSTVVVFTSLDCTTCGETRVLLRELGVSIREVTHELEPARFEAAGVEAVPMTTVVDANGAVIAQFIGVPRRRALQRAMREAGVIPA